MDQRGEPFRLQESGEGLTGIVVVIDNDDTHVPSLPCCLLARKVPTSKEGAEVGSDLPPALVGKCQGGAHKAAPKQRNFVCPWRLLAVYCHR
jgi:hypothetical protein